MRLEKVETLAQLHTGDSVFCLIAGDPVRDAKVFIGKALGESDNKYLFICQNDVGGRPCAKKDRMGYRFSWAVWLTRPSGSSDRLERLCYNDHVTGLRKVVKGAT